MSLRFYHYFTAALLFALLSSCSSMYIPAANHVSLLDKKGEGVADLTVSTTSIRLSGSYAITDDFAITTNMDASFANYSDSYDWITPTNDSSEYDFYFFQIIPGEFRHRHIELGVGGINLADRRTTRLEIFGGLGYGDAWDVDQVLELNFKSNYWQLFGQFNFGLKKEHFEFGISARLAPAYLVFNYQTTPAPGSRDALWNEYNMYFMQFKPGIFIRAGGKRLKFVFQGGLSLVAPFNRISAPVSKGFRYGRFNNTTLNLGAGISYRFSVFNEK